LANPLAQLLSQRIGVYNQANPGRALDPRAVLAVAAQEGLGGGIGDQGTSFGPFQLHFQGAYPSFAPQSPNAAQAWATSAPGIDYALRQIASVAGGLRGQSAVSNIVSRFERPANIPHEIAGALSAYGAPLPASLPLARGSVAQNPVAAHPGPSQPSAPQGPAVNPIALALRFLGF
jgi:hypothetical protein